MKKILLFTLLSFPFLINSQITLQGCSLVLSSQEYTLTKTPTATTTDSSGIERNTFETTPLNFEQACASGYCEVRIIWSIANNRWEIQLDNDNNIPPDYGSATLYYNTTASYPNPPSLSNGTWVDNLGSACGGDNSITTLTGDVQDEVLSVNEDFINNILIYPNPANSYLYLKNGTGSSIESISIFDTNGRKVISLNFDSYFYNKTIDLAQLESGFYFVNLTSNKGVGTKKLIVQ